MLNNQLLRNLVSMTMHERCTQLATFPMVWFATAHDVAQQGAYPSVGASLAASRAAAMQEAEDAGLSDELIGISHRIADALTRDDKQQLSNAFVQILDLPGSSILAVLGFFLTAEVALFEANAAHQGRDIRELLEQVHVGITRMRDDPEA